MRLTDISLNWLLPGAVLLLGMLAAVAVLARNKRSGENANADDSWERSEDRRRRKEAVYGTASYALLFCCAAVAAALSFHGLVGFGRQNLNLSGGWEYLVPFGLDGAASGLDPDTVIERTVVHARELTFHIAREYLPRVARILRDDAALRYELCTGVSAVHLPEDQGRELHAVYHLRSITHGRVVRLEVTAPDADPHLPTIVPVYPTNDWHEREAYDFFGLIFDGHPALTRIMMPDDWQGFPQRKDYPLGGIPVEYKGAQIPAPDQRRSYS